MRKHVVIFFFLFAFVVAGVMSAGMAVAATYALNLTGTADNVGFSGWDSGGTHYDQWYLQLGQFDAFQVVQGDRIETTISLDRAITIPASVIRTDFTFGLSGSVFPAGDTGTEGWTTFYNNNELVFSGPTATNSSMWLATVSNFWPPNNGAFTSDWITSDFNITALSDAASLDTAYIFFTTLSPAATPVPLPSALLLLGPGFAGLVAIRRKFLK